MENSNNIKKKQKRELLIYLKIILIWCNGLFYIILLLMSEYNTENNVNTCSSLK